MARTEESAYLVSLHAEGQIKRARIVLEDPAEGLVILGIDPFYISVVDGLAKELAIQAARKVGVEKSAVVDGFSDDTSDEFEE